MTQEQDQKNNTTTTSSSEVDIQAKLKQVYDDLSEDEKKIFYAKDAKDEEVRNEDDDIDDFWK